MEHVEERKEAEDINIQFKKALESIEEKLADLPDFTTSDSKAQSLLIELATQNKLELILNWYDFEKEIAGHFLRLAELDKKGLKGSGEYSISLQDLKEKDKVSTAIYVSLVHSESAAHTLSNLINLMAFFKLLKEKKEINGMYRIKSAMTAATKGIEDISLVFIMNLIENAQENLGLKSLEEDLQLYSEQAKIFYDLLHTPNEFSRPFEKRHDCDELLSSRFTPMYIAAYCDPNLRKLALEHNFDSINALENSEPLSFEKCPMTLINERLNSFFIPFISDSIRYMNDIKPSMHIFPHYVSYTTRLMTLPSKDLENACEFTEILKTPEEDVIKKNCIRESDSDFLHSLVNTTIAFTTEFKSQKEDINTTHK